MAHWVSRIDYVAARLSLAHHLAEGPKSTGELAGPTGTHAPSLYHLIRTLANLGILTEDVTHRFGLSSVCCSYLTLSPQQHRHSLAFKAGSRHIELAVPIDVSSGEVVGAGAGAER